MKKTEAIVLRNFSLTNSDIILTVFTPFAGKLSLIAPKAKNSRKRFGGCLDIITKINIEYIEKENSNLGKLLIADHLDDYGKLKQDYDKIMLASYFIDLINNFHPERFANANSYKLLSMVLTYMNTDAPLGNMLEAFQIKMLCALGLKIPSRNCSKCGILLSGKGATSFKYSFNDIFCDKCSSGKMSVSKNALDFVEKVSMSPIKDFLGSNSLGQNDLRYYVDFHLDGHLGKRLKSREMVK